MLHMIEQAIPVRGERMQLLTGDERTEIYGAVLNRLQSSVTAWIENELPMPGQLCMLVGQKGEIHLQRNQFVL